MLQQSHVTLSNGLQSFAEASPEYELAPLGVASIPGQLQKLAEYGRNGDIYIIHAAEGETVIPMEVLDANPKVKALLFGQMRDMGLDPQEFVVGDELNSINPDTGLPEFFFKSIFRKIKNVVKKVWKGFKKAAPIILPIAAAMFGVPFLGPMFGAGTIGAGALSSGIGTLIAGGNLKDAFKSAAISGGLAGLFSVGKGLLNPNLTAMGSLKGSLTGATPVMDAAGKLIGTRYAASPWATTFSNTAARRASQAAAEGTWGALTSGDFKHFLPESWGGTSLTDPDTMGKFGIIPSAPEAGMLNLRGATALGTITDAPLLPKGGPAPETVSDTIQLAAAPAPPRGVQTTAPPGPGESTLDTLSGIGREVREYTPLYQGSFTSPGGTTIYGEAAQKAASSAAQVSKVQELLGPGKTVADAVSHTNPKVLEHVLAAGKEAAAATMPGMYQAWGPATAIGAGTAYGMGAFDEEEPPDEPDESDLTFMHEMGPTAQERLAEDRERIARGEKPKYLLPPEAVDPYYYRRPEDYYNVAHGGMVSYPRRENLVEGPGTERSDDIPAMLSDGEFVMNSRAVRGADPTGGNNRYAGAKNLYNMMRNFEMRT